MKNKLIFMLLFAATMSLGACGGNTSNQSSVPASKAPTTSLAPSTPGESIPTPPPSSNPVAPSSAASGEDWSKVIAHTWTDGTPAMNSDNKEYVHLTDATANKVGVKISIKNYTIESDATAGTALADDGRIDAGNDRNAILTYKIKAPKAGAYQFVMRGHSKDTHTARSLNERKFTVKLNGEEVDIDDTRVPFDSDAMIDFVAAPTINLTGNEDTIKITAPYYRIYFDLDSYLIFAEH